MPKNNGEGEDLLLYGNKYVTLQMEIRHKDDGCMNNMGIGNI